MSNSDIEQTGTVKGHIPNIANLSGRISNVVSLSGHISIGSVAGDFIIKMTVETDDGEIYTVTSCDATVEQIDAAVSAEKRVVVIATDTTNGIIFDLPMLESVEIVEGGVYYFGTFLFGRAVTSYVYKVENESNWQFLITQIEAESVDYSNDMMPDVFSVGDALNKLVPKSHTHSNKAVLDKFAETDGKPTYNGEKISGASTAEEVEYTNAILPDASNVKSALDDTIDTLQTQSADTESLRAGVSALINAYETQDGDIASLKTQAHTHSNKNTLDKLSDANGKLQYNGEALGGGTSDFIIKMTVTIDDNGNYTVTSCDATVEQIDAAVAAEKRVVVMSTYTENGIVLELPMLQGVQDNFYYFGTFLMGQAIVSFVQKVSENQARWQFRITEIEAGAIIYSNDTIPGVSTVEEALNNLVPKSHTHSNKDTLDKISDSNGKLQYNGSDVGLKPVKGTDYWTAADKTEIVNDTLAALPTWTGGSY